MDFEIEYFFFVAYLATKQQSMTCDVRAVPTLVLTCDVHACGAFLGLRSAIKISHIILAIMKEIGFLLV